MKPKVSIVVPIYKAESYMHKCINSILEQTFNDWELLLVDDGSPDLSGKICDEYSIKDSRIKSIHKANGGVASARQCGLDNATGEFVIHADPDDWVEPDFLDCLYSKAVETGADFVFCDYYKDEHDEFIYNSQTPISLERMDIFLGFFYGLHAACWNKLIKRDAILRSGAHFIEGINYCEDLCFVLELFKKELKIEYVEKALYHYVQDVNSNSMIKKYDRQISDTDFELLKILCDLTRNTPAEEICEGKYSARIVRRAYDGNIFSNKEFKQRYIHLRHCLMNYDNGVLRYFYYLSCIGFYKQAKGIERVIRLFK